MSWCSRRAREAAVCLCAHRRSGQDRFRNSRPSETRASSRMEFSATTGRCAKHLDPAVCLAAGPCRSPGTRGRTGWGEDLRIQSRESGPYVACSASDRWGSSLSRPFTDVARSHRFAGLDRRDDHGSGASVPASLIAWTSNVFLMTEIETRFPSNVNRASV